MMCVKATWKTATRTNRARSLTPSIIRPDFVFGGDGLKPDGSARRKTPVIRRRHLVGVSPASRNLRRRHRQCSLEWSVTGCTYRHRAGASFWGQVALYEGRDEAQPIRVTRRYPVPMLSEDG